MNLWPGKRYNDYSSRIREIFGHRVQKISVNAGFTCPNRDGTIGNAGCLYCDNAAFSPYYCGSKETVTKQLEEGIRFFSGKYQTQQYLAYFQTYTNTYGKVERLRKLWDEALLVPGVSGLVIATRPDSVPENILNLLYEFSQRCFLVLELGVESTINASLNRIQRGHTWEQSRETILKCSAKGLRTGAHLIMGLPGESPEDMLGHVIEISKLKLFSLKIHQMQVLTGTPIADMYKQNPELFYRFSPETYIDFTVDLLEYLNPGIVAERFLSESPMERVVFPDFGGMKNFQFQNHLEKRLQERNTWQGIKYTP